MLAEIKRVLIKEEDEMRAVISLICSHSTERCIQSELITNATCRLNNMSQSNGLIDAKGGKNRQWCKKG